MRSVTSLGLAIDAQLYVTLVTSLQIRFITPECLCGEYQ